MADQSKFRITWEITEGSPFLKFYHFWYLTDEKSDDNLSFCKASWAVILALPMFVAWIFIGVFMAFAYPFIWMKERRDAKPRKVAPPRRTAKEKASKVPVRVASWANHISMWCSSVAHWFRGHPKLSKALRWSALIVPGIAVTGTLIWLLVWLIAFWHANWNWGVWDWASLSTASIVGLAILVLGVSYLLSQTVVGVWLGDGLYWIAERTLFPFGRVLRTIGRFFATVYYSTKYRTCPKIVVVKKKTSNA